MAAIDSKRLKQKYLDIIEAAKRKLELIEELEAEAAAEVSRKPRQELAEHTVTPLMVMNGVNINGEKYRAMALTDAVVDAVKQIGAGGATIPELRDYLLSNGLRSESQHILNTITTAIGRQAKKGNVRSERVRGKRRFFPVTT
jgi:hypothetical protein